MRILSKVSRHSFQPEPSVEIVYVEVVKRLRPLIEPKDKEKYEQFVKFIFKAWTKNIKYSLKKKLSEAKMRKIYKERKEILSKKPSELSMIDLLYIFKFVS